MTIAPFERLRSGASPFIHQESEALLSLGSRRSPRRQAPLPPVSGTASAAPAESGEDEHRRTVGFEHFDGLARRALLVANVDRVAVEHHNLAVGVEFDLTLLALLCRDILRIGVFERTDDRTCLIAELWADRTVV